MKITHLPAIAGFILLGLARATAASEGWTDDFEAAKAQAVKEKKDILLDFTGSDWCPWCQRLRAEVFSKEDFTRAAREKFVLVELDYPQNKAKAGITPTVAAQNETLLAKYGPSGYPSVLLCDRTGKPYAKTGYQKGGPQPYLAQLNTLIDQKKVNEKELLMAGREHGATRAPAIIKALELTQLDDVSIANFYPQIVADIKKSDPKDVTGFAKRMETSAAAAVVGRQRSELRQKTDEFFEAKDFTGAVAYYDDLIAKNLLTGVDLQQLLDHKARCLGNLGKYDEALAAIDKGLALGKSGQVAADLAELKSQMTAAKK